MVSIRLDSEAETLDLASIEKTGYGVQAMSRMTGLGLPPVQGQWQDGAGDGSAFRGQRVLARDMDMPLLLAAEDRHDLKALTSRLARVFADGCRLSWLDEEEDEWFLDTQRVGGGDWVYGEDTTGDRDLTTVVTVRAGDPFFKRNRWEVRRVGGAATSRGLLDGHSLTQLRLSSAQAIGEIQLDNEVGDATAYPVWTVVGPGHDFKAISPYGETIWWQGTLLAGQTLTIDTRPRVGGVWDQSGNNRYGELAPAPRFWRVPRGTNTAVASLLGTTPEVSMVQCAWQPRRWAVV